MIRALALTLTLWAGATGAQGAAEAATAASDRLEAAALLLENAHTRRDRVAALTETVRAYEDGLAAMRDGVRRAAIRQRSLEAELDGRRDEVARLLAVLQRMGRTPAPILTLHPAGPEGTARAGMMLADVTPTLQAEVDELRALLQEVMMLRDIQSDATATLEEGLTGAQEARAALSAAIADRTELPRRFTGNPVAMAVLIESTETLDAFASGLARTVETDLGGPVPDATAARGSLPLPLQGEVLRRFGEPDAAGITRPGWLVAARPRTLVTAPAAATLRYRGPLLDLGNVVILEPASDVLMVFAGLAEVFGETGEIVAEGAPIGLMGGAAPNAQGILSETASDAGASRQETLYIEVREGGGPVDPTIWFEAD